IGGDLSGHAARDLAPPGQRRRVALAMGGEVGEASARGLEHTERSRAGCSGCNGDGRGDRHGHRRHHGRARVHASMEVVERYLAMWRSDEPAIWSAVYVLDVIWSRLTGRLVREKLDPAVLSAEWRGASRRPGRGA
ncbi:unnamed protein product, partial [Urochloa humidicola]